MAEKMPWLWRDPKRVTHRMSKHHEKGVWLTHVVYITWCGTRISVDGVNAVNMVHRATPMCVRCAIAQEPA